jgi:hypothetical protein
MPRFTLRLISGSRKPRSGAAICLAAAVVIASGCGGDDDKKDAKAKDGTDTAGKVKRPPANTKTTPDSAETNTVDQSPKNGKSPEDQQGGAGDEQPARVPAELTGRGGRISPSRVRVPPYIAVLVQLRSADGRAYRIDVGRARALAVDGRERTASATVPGLRPGKRLLIHGRNGAGNVVVEPSAEPGP